MRFTSRVIRVTSVWLRAACASDRRVLSVASFLSRCAIFQAWRVPLECGFIVRPRWVRWVAGRVRAIANPAQGRYSSIAGQCRHCRATSAPHGALQPFHNACKYACSPSFKWCESRALVGRTSGRSVVRWFAGLRYLARTMKALARAVQRLACPTPCQCRTGRAVRPVFTYSDSNRQLLPCFCAFFPGVDIAKPYLSPMRTLHL
jgi:hypothetical protein